MKKLQEFKLEDYLNGNPELQKEFEKEYERCKMQDRFKFRCFHKPTETIFEVWRFSKDFIEATPDIVVRSIRILSVKDCILMQCTGLKDKNGKLIYEGDIVQVTTEDWKKEKYTLRYLICWDMTQWQLGFLKFQRPKAQANRRSDRKYPFNNIVSFDCYTPKRTFAKCEIIGNIYKNPELLESEE